MTVETTNLFSATNNAENSLKSFHVSYYVTRNYNLNMPKRTANRYCETHFNS